MAKDINRHRLADLEAGEACLGDIGFKIDIAAGNKAKKRLARGNSACHLPDFRGAARDDAGNRRANVTACESELDFRPLLFNQRPIGFGKAKRLAGGIGAGLAHLRCCNPLFKDIGRDGAAATQ